MGKNLKLKFGTKYRYKYKSGEHTCHVCKKGIKKDLQLHHHGKKKSKGGVSTKPIHAKCHAKTHGNYNHVLSHEDRRKAGLKTYRQNLRNQPILKGGSKVAYTHSQASKETKETFGSVNRTSVQQRVESR